MNEHPGQNETQVRLRSVERSDLDGIFELQSDVEGNRMAATIPRSRAAFDEHWEEVLDDPAACAYSILAAEQLVGTVARYRMDGIDYVGYWIGASARGQGIATQAVAQLLRRHPERPLAARVAVSNHASVRVLQKHGFKTVSRCFAEATDRFLACEEFLMQLSSQPTDQRSQP